MKRLRADLESLPFYNWSGEPWRAQEVVRKTLNLFSASPGGLPGNDDLGATSSWIVFAQLGLYPEIPAVAGFTTKSPSFPQADLTLGDNHHLEIVAQGAPEKLYIDALSADGKPIGDSWISWRAMLRTSRMEYRLMSKTTATDTTHPGIAPNTQAP